MHKSHYAKYILERENKQIIEDDNGFATYSYVDDGIYIEDVYIIPEKRDQRVASAYAAILIDIAKKKGLKYLYTSVATNVNGSTESAKKMIGFGFKILNCDSETIYFIKEIE